MNSKKIIDFVCEHGCHAKDNSFTGIWNGPISYCECCGANFVYIDSMQTYWFPTNRCAGCGGAYVEGIFKYNKGLEDDN